MTAIKRRQALWLLAGSTLAACTGEGLPTIQAPPSSFLDQLRLGGYVIYLRHAIATVGSDSFTGTNWWTSLDPAIARQLSDEGRAQATRIGAHLRSLAIPIGQLVSSEFRRCVETAERLALTTRLETTLDLSFTFDPFRTGEGILRRLQTLPAAGQNTLLVAHLRSGEPISELGSLQQGDAAVFKPDGRGNSRFVTYISDASWQNLEDMPLI